MLRSLIILTLFAISLNIACSGKDGRGGKDGSDCTIESNEDGAVITCGENDPVTIRNGEKGDKGPAGQSSNGLNGDDGDDGDDGAPGADGESCSATLNGDGTATITCPDLSLIHI